MTGQAHTLLDVEPELSAYTASNGISRHVMPTGWVKLSCSCGWSRLVHRQDSQDRWADHEKVLR